MSSPSFELRIEIHGFSQKHVEETVHNKNVISDQDLQVLGALHEIVRIK